MELNPKGEVPVLVVNGSPIVESEKTVDHLMEDSLNPPERRAVSSRWRSLINDRLKPVGKRTVLSGGSEADKASLCVVLQELDACLQGQGTAGSHVGTGPFVCGEAFTAADASAFPFLQRIHGEFGFPAGCHKLEEWYEAARRRPAVRKTIKKEWWWWW